MGALESLATMAAVAEAAQQIFPVRGLVHAGFGLGTGPSHQWQTWSVPWALMVEAEPQRHSRFNATQTKIQEWKSVSAVLSDRDGDAEFYVASNPAESGLVPPPALQRIWPNLATVATKSCQTVRLETLL